MLKNKYTQFVLISVSILLSVCISTIALILYAEKIPYFEKKLIKNVEKQLYTMHQTVIFDNFCGSYKKFILENDTHKLLKSLYKNLDEESIEKVNMNLNSILHVPDSKYIQYFYFRSSMFNQDFKLKLNTFKAQTDFLQEKPQMLRKYKLPKDATYIYGVFYDHHNLRFAPEKVKKYVQDKIFLDIGAYVGDSVLVLLEYNPSLIYSFEIADGNIERYKQTMKMNNIPSNKYELVKLAIAERKGKFKIAGEWEMEGIESVYPVEQGQTVYSTDVDSFMKEKGGKVGFIKADVQGIMHKAINGMKETIKRDRPVLLLDISDSPQDFFYTKPILEDIVKDLNYTIKITTFNSGDCIIGTSLWAYPKELDN